MLEEAITGEAKESEDEGALVPDLGDTTDRRSDAEKLHIQHGKMERARREQYLERKLSTTR